MQDRRQKEVIEQVKRLKVKIQRKKEEKVRRQKEISQKGKVMEQNDLSKRLFIFSVRTIKFLRTLPYETEYKVIRYQLIKSATSVGANYSPRQI